MDINKPSRHIRDNME